MGPSRHIRPVQNLLGDFLDLTVEKVIIPPNGAWFPCQTQDRAALDQDRAGRGMPSGSFAGHQGT